MDIKIDLTGSHCLEDDLAMVMDAYHSLTQLAAEAQGACRCQDIANISLILDGVMGALVSLRLKSSSK